MPLRSKSVAGKSHDYCKSNDDNLYKYKLYHYNLYVYNLYKYNL